MQKQIKNLVPDDAVILGTGMVTVQRIIQETPNYPEYRVQWVGITSNLTNRVDFLPTEWVEVESKKK